MDYTPIYKKIDEMMCDKKNFIVAIDGCCAAGKTTLAASIKARYDCNVFTTDDFFLQPHQRTPERFAEPGGNVDYERFYNEVIVPLPGGAPFAYRPYDCGVQALAAPIDVRPTLLSVVEGAYCMHPSFGNVYDIKVFMSIDPDEQRRRLLARNPALYERFVNEWIPMEHAYFDAFGIRSQCDFHFSAEK